MPRLSSPPEMYEFIVLQALRHGPLIGPHLVERMLQQEERNLAFRLDVDDDALQRERAARLERAGDRLVVGIERSIQGVGAALRYVGHCCAAVAAMVQEVGTSKRG